MEAVEIGRIIAPDPLPTSPASAEAHSGGGGSVVAFIDRISTPWGPGGSPLVVPGVALLLGGLKEQDIRGWFLTTRDIFPFRLI